VSTFQLPYYCKIDVEGWEYEVLLGFSHAIPLMSFEFHLSERGVAKTKCVPGKTGQLRTGDGEPYAR
jgi:hypothetical protein